MKPTIFCWVLSILVMVSHACTIGVFGPSATVDGRIVLWKNRDVTNPDQEMGVFRGPRYRFVANVYAGETLDVWAGINEAGFAIMNSNSYNLSGYGAGADDGNIMRQALGSCATVEDFAKLMDSLNTVGRETPANYGVFDATGAAAIFEASNTYYYRFDVDRDSLGFQLRANFSLAGGPSRLLGKNRFERAMELCTARMRESRISMDFIIRVLSRDLGQVGFEPYPLPFLGRMDPLPYGYLPIDTTIARVTTRSVEIMVGPQPGASPNTGMMWVLLGSPLATIPVPLWIQGGAVPKELNGANTALLCDEAKRLFSWLCPDPDFPKAVNTFRLARWLDYIATRESIILQLVAEKEQEWGPDGPDSLAAAQLTRYVCQLAVAAYQEFWQENDPKFDAESERARLTVQRSGRTETLHRLPPRIRLFDVAGRRVFQYQPGVMIICDDSTRQKLLIIN
ncbi:MAG: carcinine hydrolase/isopenicillin-N N-acyltransferase family protein [candidate division WOR-3 bacterium]